jgi:tetratricopeptide (TPR) repeat protein
LAGPLPVQAAVLAILLLGFALRLHRLAAESLWLDEMGQASVAMQGLLGAIEGARRHHGAAPLDYVFTWLALQVGHSDFLVRLPAALLGTLTLALLYRLGRALFDVPVALLATLLLAVAPLHLRYSQEVRFYALFACMAVASSLALVMALRRGDRRHWAVYALTLAAGLYSHYYIGLVALIHGLVVVAHDLWPDRLPLPREPRDTARFAQTRRFLLSGLLAVLAFVPWLVYGVLAETGTPRATPPDLTLGLLETMLAGLTLGHAAETPGLVPTWPSWLYAGLALLGGITGLVSRRSRLGAALAGLLLVLCPPLIVLALHLINYFFSIRQLLFLLPFYLLLVALGTVWLARTLAGFAADRPWRGIVGGAAAAGLAAMLIWPLRPAIDASYHPQRQDWRDALAFVTANAGPDDALLVPGVGAEGYLRYYAADWVQRLQAPASFDQVKTMAQGRPATWIVAIPSTLPIARPVEGEGALRIEFGPNMLVYYWQPGHSPQEVLAQTINWTLPDSSIALESLVRQYDAADMPEQADRVASLAAQRALDPQEASLFELARGNVWRARGANQRAVDAYRHAVELWPGNAEAWTRLGDRLLAMGDPVEAAAVLEKAVALEPGHYWAQRLLGEAYWREDQFDQAAAHYQAAVTADPAAADTYFFLGRALAASDDGSGAATAFQQYLALAPEGQFAAEARDRLDALH